MSATDFLSLAYQVASPLVMLLGLWIAARWLPDVKGWLSGIGAGSIATNPAGQLIVWIVLGELFANPLADWIGMLITIIQVGLGPAGNMGTMSTVWGQGSFAVYSDVSVLMTLAIYVLVVWAGYRLWPEATEEEDGVKTGLALEEWFILLAAASLVNRFVDSIVMRLIWLPVPNAVDTGRLSSVGLVGAWLLGLAILAAILLVLLNILRRSQSAG